MQEENDNEIPEELRFTADDFELPTSPLTVKKKAKKNESKKFQFAGKKMHLTYTGHIPLMDLKNFLEQTLGEMVWYSLVWENGKTNTSNAHAHAQTETVPGGQPDAATVAYAHTHVAFELKKKTTFTSERKLDYLQIHPNIKSIQTIEHACNIWEYHLKEPLQSLRSPKGPKKPIGSEMVREIMNAPSLAAAIELTGVEIKSVSDLVLIRNNKQRAQEIPELPVVYSWRTMLTGEWHTVYLYGKTGIGKTQWAIAQLHSPLLVSMMEDLKQYNADVHDGIIFDDICLNSMPSNAVIHLMDWDLPRSINVKYGSVTIPAHTKKIVTSNLSPEEHFRVFPQAHTDAIMRRLTVITETQPLFIKPASNMTERSHSSNEEPQYYNTDDLI